MGLGATVLELQPEQQTRASASLNTRLSLCAFATNFSTATQRNANVGRPGGADGLAGGPEPTCESPACLPESLSCHRLTTCITAA